MNSTLTATQLPHYYSAAREHQRDGRRFRRYCPRKRKRRVECRATDNVCASTKPVRVEIGVADPGLEIRNSWRKHWQRCASSRRKPQESPRRQACFGLEEVMT